MKFSSNIGLKIHNRFDIQVKDAETMEVIQTAQAENIVLDRIYTRLLNFQSYFDQIVFGSGTGALSASGTTLFTRIGNKAAVTESLVRSYPTSVWTRSIRLGTEEFNGQTIREVGISETTTNINTHALITDSEGNPLSVDKTSLKIIDIYATVFVEVYSVDSGCFFYANGLRDYLTGGSAPANTLRLFRFSDDDAETLTATKTSNSGEKSISFAVRFNVQHFNKDVRAIDWVGGGLRWLIPRTGVYTGTAKTNVQLGVGNGSNDTFALPNKEVTGLTVKVDGTATTAYTRTFDDKIILDSAPANDLLVTADYTTKYIPKDSDHVLDVTMEVAFAGGIPTPVVPDIDYSGLPGPKVISGGNAKLGLYGETPAADLITAADLCTAMGLTAGTLINADANWLKYAYRGNIIYAAKKNIKHSVSWDHINAVGSVFGERIIEIGGKLFAVRLLSTQEWDKLIYPVHVNYGQWAQFTDAELNIIGVNTWTSSPSGASRIIRGGNGVTISNYITPSSVNSVYGFRPVLVYLKTL